jgi:hypothetical protein
MSTLRTCILFLAILNITIPACFSQDYVIKKSGDSIIGTIEEWRLNGVKITTVDKPKGQKFKPSEISKIGIPAHDFSATTRFIENRGQYILFPDHKTNDTLIAFSKTDTLRIIASDTLQIIVFSEKYTGSTWGGTFGAAGAFMPGARYVTINYRAYAFSPNYGVNLIHEPDPAEVDRIDSYDQLQRYFGNNPEIHQTLEAGKEKYKFLSIYYKYEIFSKYLGRSVTLH